MHKILLKAQKPVRAKTAHRLTAASRGKQEMVKRALGRAPGMIRSSPRAGIDALVDKLYGLADQEIKFVEGS
jgi:hypothetical protein